MFGSRIVGPPFPAHAIPDLIPGIQFLNLLVRHFLISVLDSNDRLNRDVDNVGILLQGFEEMLSIRAGSRSRSRSLGPTMLEAVVLGLVGFPVESNTVKFDRRPETWHPDSWQWH